MSCIEERPLRPHGKQTSGLLHDCRDFVLTTYGLLRRAPKPAHAEGKVTVAAT